LEQVQRRTTETGGCDEGLRELGLFSLEKRSLQGNLIVAFQYLKGAYEKNGEKHFSKACSDRTRGNSLLN